MIDSGVKPQESFQQSDLTQSPGANDAFAPNSGLTVEFPTKRLNPVAGSFLPYSPGLLKFVFPTKRLNPVAGR